MINLGLYLGKEKSSALRTSRTPNNRISETKPLKILAGPAWLEREISSNTRFDFDGVSGSYRESP